MPEVRIVDEEGEQLGVLPIQEARRLADEKGLDLVEVAPNQYPPVCRILDYGKFRFIQSKKAKEAKKSQSKILMKDVRLRMRIGEHDMKSKENKIRTFISSGYKVRVSVFFRGREMAHQDRGEVLLERIKIETDEFAKVELLPKFEGRQMIMVLAPK